MNGVMVRMCLVFCVVFLRMHGKYLRSINASFCCFLLLIISSFGYCISASGFRTFRPAGRDKTGNTNVTGTTQNGGRSGGTWITFSSASDDVIIRMPPSSAMLFFRLQKVRRHRRVFGQDARIMVSGSQGEQQGWLCEQQWWLLNYSPESLIGWHRAIHVICAVTF